MTVIDEESDRLNRLVGEAAEVAPRFRSPTNCNSTSRSVVCLNLVQAALAEVKQSLGKHPMEIRVPEENYGAFGCGPHGGSPSPSCLENAAMGLLPNLPSGSQPEVKAANLEVRVSPTRALQSVTWSSS